MNQVAPSTRPLMKRALAAIQKQKANEAMQLLQQVLALNPDHAEALHNVAFILHSAGNFPQAFDYYQRAMHADPNYIESYLGLCRLLQAQNRADEAIKVAQRAIEIAPDNFSTHAELVSQLMRFNIGHAVPLYLEGIRARFPNEPGLLQLYCMSLKSNERLAEADAVYEQLITEHRVPASVRILYETYLPRLSRSREEIEQVRARFKKSLEGFIAEKARMIIEQMTFQPIFQLAYHNADNKELTQLYVKMLRTVAPQVNYVAPHCKADLARADGKIRIGFVSAHMHHHSVGNCYRDVMLDLARNPDFDVKFFNLSNIVDDKISEIDAAGVPIIMLPKTLQSSQDVIAGHKLDILIYPDIGMHAMTHYLAMSRLARYQCVLHGHPETTGIDTIDYYITWKFYEPENAQENYTEKLLVKQDIDTRFKRPKAPPRWLTREEAGLPTDKKLYICPMTIQKFHPDFDYILADILARDPNGVIVLFNDFQQQSASDLMKERITKICDPSRIIFMPWLDITSLFSVMKLADALLETVHFGGGTTLQFALSFGIPIVSMPGRYARARVLNAFYDIMGITDAPRAKTPQEYAELAVKLANDTEYHQKLSKEIEEKSHLLFDAQTNPEEMAQIMRDIMAQKLDGYRQ